MSIALLYERSENDENGIKLTAKQLGIDLAFIPFRKIALSLSQDAFSAKTKGKDYTPLLNDVKAVLNRAQSKNRRLQASYIMEALGKKTLNTSQAEFVCYSKLRTLIQLSQAGVPIPKTVFVPCDAVDVMKNGKEIHNEKDIADLFTQNLPLNEGIVVKADAGTHGKMIMLSKNRDELEANIKETKVGIINPVGVVAQQLIKKWFYDLRVIVYKEKGKSPVCYHTAMARAGSKDFRTNTFLGNLVFHAKLPQKIRELAIKCGETLGKDTDAYIFALRRDGQCQKQQKPRRCHGQTEVRFSDPGLGARAASQTGRNSPQRLPHMDQQTGSCLQNLQGKPRLPERYRYY